jgi:uncharacterized protein (TIGR03083 family)
MSYDVPELLDALQETWESTIDACTGLTEADWDRPTGCPGWSVKDNLSHIVGLERELHGEPIPPDDLPDHIEHVTGPAGRHMELAVAARRDRPGDEVLAEMRAFSAERLAALRALPQEEWEGTTPGPMGSELPAAGFLGIRVFDCWAHEQDIRRALGRPGGLDGLAARVSRDRVASGLGYVLVKKAGVPDGTTVALHLTGPSSATFGARVEGGRGDVSDEAPAEAAVAIHIPFAEFMALACGRSDADAGTAEIEGDADLGNRILSALAVTP